MIIDLFSKSLGTPQSLPESVVKANRLFVENMEQVLVFQMSALQSYLNMGLNQLKAAAEISDAKSLQDFCKRQTEIAKVVQEKLMSDAKAMMNMATHFKAEFDDLTQATLGEILPKAA